MSQSEIRRPDAADYHSGTRPRRDTRRLLQRPSQGANRATGDVMRHRVGAVLAPLVFLLLLALPFSGLTPAAHRLAGVLAAVVVLWVTEALPLAATALLGAAACVVLRVAPAKDVFAPFADPLMFLFIGAFIISRAIFLHGLDRRLAFSVLSLPWVGARPARILLAFGQ